MKRYINRMSKRGLSLFELLVVLMVIFVLAIIMLLSFPHVMVSTKISRVKEEHVALVRALTNYHLDYNRFPPTYMGLSALSAPTAYLGVIPIDPFTLNRKQQAYFYIESPSIEIAYLLISNGPDSDNDLIKMYISAVTMTTNNPAGVDTNYFNYIIPQYLATRIYDPTNGLNSNGDIVYIGRK